MLRSGFAKSRLGGARLLTSPEVHEESDSPDSSRDVAEADSFFVFSITKSI